MAWVFVPDEPTAGSVIVYVWPAKSIIRDSLSLVPSTLSTLLSPAPVASLSITIVDPDGASSIASLRVSQAVFVLGI